MPPIKFSSRGWKLTDTPFAAHVQIPSGTDIVQASVSGITYTVNEAIGPQTVPNPTGSGSCNPATSVFNALVPPSTDPSWTEDNAGYNFKFTIPGAAFPDTGEYIVLFMFTPTGGGTPIPLEFIHHAYDTV